ncbi:MAG TPA: TonB-dependent receptor [Thermoanaerobaculaceae bacterium]|nr:TonB-dependent receptor [Thermoanaerobaculaceae bacterium]
MALRLARFLPIVLVLAAVAGAQPLPVYQDQVVVTATAEPESPDRVAAATTVISASDLQAAGVTSLADALRWVPGLTVLRSGLDNGVVSLFTRGTSSTHTLVMWDGVKLNSPFFGGYDWSVPLAAGVERVEVVRGPYSALYGGDAIGGVVQLFPVSGGADRVSAAVEGGGSGWRRAEVEGVATSGRWEAVVAGGSRDGSGPLANDGFSSRVALASLTATLGEGDRIGVLFHRTTEYTEIPFSGAQLTPHRSTSAAETMAAVPFHWHIGSGGDLEATVSRVERDLRYSDPDDPSGFVRSDTVADTDDARLVLHRRLAAHALVLGGEWQGDRVTDGSNYGVNLDGTSRTTRSVFVQDSWTPAPRLSVLAGVRWDRSAPWGGEFSPRASVSWDGGPWRAWISAGRAFRAPSLGELYYPYSGNPALTPERSRSAEAGVLLPLAGGDSALQVVGFSNRQRGLIDFDFATYRYSNIDRARQEGVEGSWIAAVGNRAKATAAVTWLRARDGNGEALLRRPEWSGSLTVEGTVARSVEGSASLVWVGARTDLDPVTFERVPQGGFVTANVAATVPLGAGLSVRARVENVGDRSYEEVRGYPAPPRRVFLGLVALLH